MITSSTRFQHVLIICCGSLVRFIAVVGIRAKLHTETANENANGSASSQLHNLSCLPVNILFMPAAHWRALRICGSIWAIAKLDCRYRGSRPARSRGAINVRGAFEEFDVTPRIDHVFIPRRGKREGEIRRFRPVTFNSADT